MITTTIAPIIAIRGIDKVLTKAITAVTIDFVMAILLAMAFSNSIFAWLAVFALILVACLPANVAFFFCAGLKYFFNPFSVLKPCFCASLFSSPCFVRKPTFLAGFFNVLTK